MNGALVKAFPRDYAYEYRNPNWPPVPDGALRVVLHLFPDRETFAAFREGVFDDGEKWDQEHEPGAYTDYDDIWEHEYPGWRNALDIGTEKVIWHELTHIARRQGNSMHHALLGCSWGGLCVSAGHGARLVDAHFGYSRATARALLAITRRATPDAFGVRHGYLDVPEPSA